MLTKNTSHPAITSMDFESKEAHDLFNKYNTELEDKLKLYFGQTYINQSVMMIEFNKLNKEWKNLCKFVNGSNKLLNLNDKAFEFQVKLVNGKVQYEQLIKKENGIHLE